MRQLLLILLLLLGLMACQQATSPPQTTTAVTTIPQPTNTPRPTRTPISAPATPTAVPTTHATTTNPNPTPIPPTVTVAPSPPANHIDIAAQFGPGALIALEMRSTVGVLLDDYPADQRDRIAQALLNQPAEIWHGRATQQFELTYNRLHFRDFTYAKIGLEDKGQLPYPPRQLWQITLDKVGPRRATIDNHDLIVWDYTYTSTLLSDTASAAEAEPLLATEGGVWEEPFRLPADASQLLQRTGNACLNEAGFPPNSYDSENIATFFDYTCQAEDGGLLGCHRLTLPTLSCEAAMRSTVGIVDTAVRFERLPWDDELADRVRLGHVTHANAPDLTVVQEELDNHRLEYRYFSADDCAMQEGNVGAAGWRRLLKFDAAVHNVGAVALDIGLVEAEDPTTNIYVYDPCHNHIHYSNYGEFLFGDYDQPNKRAFCVESTGRFSNNEAAPLTHSYSCRVQGIQAGWVDEYGAGLDGQWIDVTDAVPTQTLTAAPLRLPLTFQSNVDRFLCEGEPILDDNGEQRYIWSDLVNERGLPMAYPACELVENWNANNSGTAEILLPPTGSLVTAACQRGETGPQRNCGFTADVDTLTCTPGQPVQLSCQLNPSAGQTAVPQTLRLCETSQQLGTGIACTHAQTLANLIITEQPTAVTFTCPLGRDAQETGGGYALYTAPTFAGDEAVSITCK